MSTPPDPTIDPLIDPLISFDQSIEPHVPYKGLHGRYGPYIPDSRLIDAANVALTLQLPLLLTGDPGCGKTEFAYVAADALGRKNKGEREPLECQIRSDTQARDLLYHYDPIRRFAEGQHGDEDARRRALDARNYVELRPLGFALMATRQRVVLIDEIDKAPRDLPNDLLRELDRKRSQFEITEITDADARYGPVAYENISLAREMKRPKGARMPFVVITSNTERQLPDAFLRRCVFFHIPFPGDRQLQNILEAHLRAADQARRAQASTGPASEAAGESASESADEAADESADGPRLQLRNRIDPDDPGDRAYIEKLAGIFLRARNIPDLAKQPSTAEWLDWVGALDCFDQRVRDRIAGFWDMLCGETEPDKTTWLDLPGLACLIKLREDLERAERAALS